MAALAAIAGAIALSVPGLAKPPVEASPPPVLPEMPAWPQRMTSEHMLRSDEGLEYRIFLSVPKGPAPADGYPVIYILDGNAWFGAAAEIARLKEPQYGPSLVVGIGYPGDTPINTARRVWDFTLGAPKTQPPFDVGTRFGGAPAFRTFLRTRLREDLAKRFPLAPGRTTLFGHSLGGLFVLETLLAAPDAFDTFVAASPAINWNRDEILRRTNTFRPGRGSARPRILLEMGGLEQRMTDDLRRMAVAMSGPNGLFKDKSADQLAAFIEQNIRDNAMIDNIQAVARRFQANGVRAPLIIFEGEDHGSVIPAALSRALSLGLDPAPVGVP
jgi:predicted alpha/beta superfamily hydrolase